jgi:hypothetical protein
VIGPEDEAVHDAVTDAVTFSFGDEEKGLFGLARLGRGRSASVLALLFAGGEPAVVLARDGAVDGLAAETEEPLRRWTVRLDGDAGFELAFEALGPPAELGEDAARAGGMAGYEQLCRVTGRVRADHREREVSCLGQRGHAWGEPDWSRMEAARSLSAWLPGGHGLALSAVRPAGARHHAAETAWAALLAPGGAVAVHEPRLSTTYDEEGRQLRAGLELWVDEQDDHPHFAAGEAICGSTVDLGGLRLECAFFRWHMEGQSGVGRYDVLRRPG